MHPISGQRAAGRRVQHAGDRVRCRRTAPAAPAAVTAQPESAGPRCLDQRRHTRRTEDQHRPRAKCQTVPCVPARDGAACTLNDRSATVLLTNWPMFTGDVRSGCLGEIPMRLANYKKFVKSSTAGSHSRFSAVLSSSSAAPPWLRPKPWPPPGSGKRPPSPT